MLYNAKKSKFLASAIVSVIVAQALVFTPVALRADTKDVQDFVGRSYQIAFNRTPEEAGMNYWVEQLGGAIDGPAFASFCIFSDEYKALNKSDKDFVIDLYKLFMDRDADENGLNYWINELANGKTREDIFGGFAYSEEFKQICDKYGIGKAASAPEKNNVDAAAVKGFVERLYNNCLKRAPEEAGLQYWIGCLSDQSCSGYELAKNFFVSREYEDQKVDDKTFLTDLYKVFMDREADEAGLDYWLSVLNADSNREAVIDGFANSVEFATICAGYGINSGTGTAPAIVEDEPQLYRMTKRTTTDENGVTVSTFKYGIDENTLSVETVTNPDGSTYTITNLADGRSISSYEGADYIGSFTFKESNDGDKTITESYNGDGKYVGKTITEPVKNGYKYYYFDENNEPSGFSWVERTMNEDNLTVTTSRNEDGSVYTYTIDQIGENGEFITTTYDAKDQVLEKVVKAWTSSGDLATETITDGSGKVISKTTIEYSELKEVKTTVSNGKTTTVVTEFEEC